MSLSDRYICERLSTQSENKRLIETFSNNRNPNLAEYIRKSAWQDDKDGWNAIYIVKDKDCNEEIVLYFGLKGGMISLPFSEGVYYLLKKKEGDFLQHLPKDEKLYLTYIKEFLETAQKEDEIDKVAETMPGIELSHFCINDTYRDRLRKNKQDTKGLGEYLYFSEILPIVDRVRELIGCKFLYLFAADDTEEEALISYYRDRLNFQQISEFDSSALDDRAMIPIMPFYDYKCEFMVYPFEDREQES